MYLMFGHKYRCWSFVYFRVMVAIFAGSFPVFYDEYADSYVEIRIKVRGYYEEVSKSSVDDVSHGIRGS